MVFQMNYDLYLACVCFHDRLSSKITSSNKTKQVFVHFKITNKRQWKDGYTQVEIDHLFKAIVLPKITYSLPVYRASQLDLNTIQCFLKRCNKRLYTSELINIYDLLEKCDRRLFTKIKNNVNHPLKCPFAESQRVIQEVKIISNSITTD